jgi:L-asparaginase / beta-aspartyl-peptidase
MGATMLIAGTHNTADGVMRGLAILQSGGSAVDAVEAVLRAVEDNTADDSVGWGGLPNLLGDVEQDASIMDGERLRSGAVGALRGVRYPSFVARRVMDVLPHVFLVGEGAARFAREMGAEAAPPCEASQAKYHRWLEAVGLAEAVATAGEDAPLRDLLWRSVRHRTSGTANAIAIDAAGHVCSGVTTSGWAYKYPGRLGDSPIIGAGHYADDRYGAAACTGLGEATIRLCTAHTVVQHLAAGQRLEAAADAAVGDLARLDVPIPFSVNVLAVDRDGRHTLRSTGASAPTYLVAEPGDAAPRSIPGTGRSG